MIHPLQAFRSDSKDFFYTFLGLFPIALVSVVYCVSKDSPIDSNVLTLFGGHTPMLILTIQASPSPVMDAFLILSRSENILCGPSTQTQLL